jgi:glucosamine kinase
MVFYLGIDGGGSKTSCVIGDENSVLGAGSAAGSNVVRVGEAQARESLFAAIRQACNSAGISAQQITHTCVGVAGAARPQISDTVRRLLSQIVGGEIQIVGDMVIALEGAFGGGPGIVVIAGTGSIAYGVNAENQTARAGGWGFAISDEGSGHWIGRAAVSAAMRCHDQEEDDQRSALLAAILKAWTLENLEQLVVMANASPPPDFSRLFPAVLAMAEAGDSAARQVLTHSGDELARLGEIVLRRLFSEATSVPVAMTGGVFASSALVREVFYNSLRSACPNATVKSGVVDPVIGALALARKGRA